MAIKPRVSRWIASWIALADARYFPSIGTLYISRSLLAKGRIASRQAALLLPSMVDRFQLPPRIRGMPEHVTKAHVFAF